MTLQTIIDAPETPSAAAGEVARGGEGMTTVTLHKSNIARCNGLEVKSRGMTDPIAPLCRLLLDESAAKPFDDVLIYRDGTLCFTPAPLIWWASTHCTESDDLSVRTTVYKARPMPEASA